MTQGAAVFIHLCYDVKNGFNRKGQLAMAVGSRSPAGCRRTRRAAPSACGKASLHLPATHLPATHLPATHLPATHLPATHLPATCRSLADLQVALVLEDDSGSDT